MRIRTIKPEFFKHEELFELERSSGLPIRIAFVGLWCAADRDGRFRWRPRQLGTDVLPYDNLPFDKIMDLLAAAGFITKYKIGNEVYGCVPSFSEHQCVNQREAQSKIPPFIEGSAIEVTMQRTCTHVHAHAKECTEKPADSSQDVKSETIPQNDEKRTCMHMHARGEGKGKEGKGKEGEAASPELFGATESGGEGAGRQTPPAAPTRDPLDIPKELHSPEFTSAWHRWMTIRRGMKQKVKDWNELFGEQLDWLKQFGATEATEILKKSIRNGYQGLFSNDGNGRGSGATAGRHQNPNFGISGATESKAERVLARRKAEAEAAVAGKVPEP